MRNHVNFSCVNFSSLSAQSLQLYVSECNLALCSFFRYWLAYSCSILWLNFQEGYVSHLHFATFKFNDVNCHLAPQQLAHFTFKLHLKWFRCVPRCVLQRVRDNVGSFHIYLQLGNDVTVISECNFFYGTRWQQWLTVENEYNLNICPHFDNLDKAVLGPVRQIANIWISFGILLPSTFV